MRFNGKELAALALQPSHKFDKEGILLVRERQEGLFRRGEISAERWCRLRGNMLFYFKNRDQYSEAAGVIILEQCSVHLDTTCEDGPYSFTIVFDIDGGTIQFCASSEQERDAWIQALHMASYEYMRTQLNTLSAKLEEKMEKIKTITKEDSKNIWTNKNLTDLSEEPYLEISISCDNLMCDGDGQPPNPVVFVSLIIENQTQWLNYAQTEVIERSSNPCFLTTVNLRLSDLNVANTKIKLAVYDVRERLTSTMTFLGSAIFSFESLSADEKNNARLALMSGDDMAVGFISVACWKLNTENRTEISENGSARVNLQDQPVDTYQLSSLPVGLIPKSRLPHCGNLNLLFDNIISRSYRFHTGLGADLSVHEIMGESKYCFTLPQKILQLFIKEEKDLLHTLTSMGNLREDWNKRQTDLLERHLHLINTYTLALHHMDSYPGASFKPSSIKNSQNLEFIPVNLHVQRLCVHNDSVKKSATYDVFTVGAFAAHSKRYRHGGLSRLLNQLRQQKHEGKNDKLANITEAVARIKHLKSCIEDLIQQLNVFASNKNASEMCSTMTDISTKSHQFVGICDSALIDEACSILEEMRTTQIDGQDISEGSAGNLKSPIHDGKQTVKERSKSIDGPYLSSRNPHSLDNCDSIVNLDRVTIEPKTIIEETNNVKLPVLNTKKLDNRKDTGSPRSLRRRGIRMTRHGSLKDDKLKTSSVNLRTAVVCDKNLDLTTKEETESLEINTGVKTNANMSISATSNLVIANNAKNEENCALTSNDNDGPNAKGKSATRSKSPDEPEPWDLTQLNIEASIMCMSSKVKSLCRNSSNNEQVQNANCIENVEQLNWAEKLAPSIRKLSQALSCLLRTANLAHIIYLLMEPLQLAAQQRSVQHRRDVVFIHVLTSVTVGIMTKLWDHRLDATYLLRMSKVGMLAQFEGLLSCHGDEMGMLEDMIVAIDDVSKVTFKIVQSTDSTCPVLPTVEGGRLLMTVTIPVPDSVINLLPTECSKGFSFHVTPTFFNVGINEQATIAERESCSPSCMHSVPLSARKSIACMYSAAPNPNRFGDMSLQDKINNDGLERLNEFYGKYRQVPITAERASRHLAWESIVTVIPEILDHLKVQVHSKRGKNVEILHLASKVCRLLGGLRYTSCKSAKDRTSMSATLEQCLILREQFDLAEPEFYRALECMRCEGTRRENALKNAGVKKYAFNSLQLMALPKLYRPPAGTYGNVQT